MNSALLFPTLAHPLDQKLLAKKKKGATMVMASNTMKKPMSAQRKTSSSDGMCFHI